MVGFCDGGRRKVVVADEAVVEAVVAMADRGWFWLFFLFLFFLIKTG